MVFIILMVRLPHATVRTTRTDKILTAYKYLAKDIDPGVIPGKKKYLD